MTSLDDGIESASFFLLFSKTIMSLFHICQLGLSKKEKKLFFSVERVHA